MPKAKTVAAVLPDSPVLPNHCTKTAWIFEYCQAMMRAIAKNKSGRTKSQMDHFHGSLACFGSLNVLSGGSKKHAATRVIGYSPTKSKTKGAIRALNSPPSTPPIDMVR